MQMLAQRRITSYGATQPGHRGRGKHWFLASSVDVMAVSGFVQIV
jgi:hypothetical protein